jgi:serine O-acetyltransferase
MKLRKTILADYNRLLVLSDAKQTKSWFKALLSARALPVVMIRLAQKLDDLRMGILGKLILALVYFLFRIEVPLKAEIGSGFVLPHAIGIVLGSAKIGENVTIFQNVTLGARFFDGGYNLEKRPTLADGVTIGSGAVVLGPIVIGEGAVVAANSLAIEDVPPNKTAVGVPAKVANNEK